MVFPNPGKDKLTVIIPERALGANGNIIYVYNSIGQRVLKQIINNSGNSIQLSISHLKPGVYRLVSGHSGGVSAVSFINQ